MDSIKRYEAGMSFSQMVVHDGRVYLAGQVTADETLLTTVATQTASCLEKIDRLLELGGSHKSAILCANVWLADIATVADMNAVWNTWVDPKCKPVRATVEAKLVRPTLLVEIQVVAATINDVSTYTLSAPRRPTLGAVDTDNAAKAVGPYNQAVVVEGEYVFVSGCLGLDPETNALVDGGIEEQTQRALQNVGAILESSGAPRLVKLTVMVKNMGDFGVVNSLYGAFLNSYGADPKPARTAFEVSALPKDALIMIDAVARV